MALKSKIVAKLQREGMIVSGSNNVLTSELQKNSNSKYPVHQLETIRQKIQKKRQASKISDNLIISTHTKTDHILWLRWQEPNKAEKSATN